jgi:hypothetical protein
MFQSTKKRMQALLDVVDDMLVGAPDPEPETLAPHSHPHSHPHPHRRPLQPRRQRRAGTVAARPMHCLSPVRSPAPPTADRDLTR